MFTLEETVVKYAWNEAEGGDLSPTEHILDLAPRPFVAEIVKARQKRKRENGKDCCPRHKGCWKTELDKLFDLCRDHFTECFLQSMTAHLEARLCSCDEANKKSSEFNMPVDTFEMEVWELYTYFLNLFNTRLKSDHPLQHFRSAIFDTVVQCVIFMEVHRYFFLQGLKSLFQHGLLEETVSWKDSTDSQSENSSAS